MTREERENAIAILENEKKCVNRANKNDYCNRDCYNCELVKTDTEILTALDMAIKALSYDDAKYHAEHGEVIVDKAVWEDAERALEPSDDLIQRQAVLDLLEDTNNGWIINEVLQLPSVKPQSCEDAISRQGDDRWLIHFGQNMAIPSAEPKTGHWIIIDDCEKFIAKCSECGQIEDSRMIGKYAYCHCGARMECEQNG